jgi:glycosyltransferase involved in cell wall biosynthesis
MTASSLRDLYLLHQGKVSDKWSLYLDTYDEIFSPLKGRKIRLLEIGIQNGGSLEIWADYFSQAELFVGVDINEACRTLKYRDPRIKLLIGDINTEQIQEDILQHSREFDILLDDGSHTSSDIILSFARYFSYLKDGAIYVAEDLHCSYWKAFGGGVFHPTSSISFFKRLADILNFEHWGVAGKRADILFAFSQEYGCTLSEDDLQCIYSIEFRNSLCIIRKRSAQSAILGPRVVVGTEAKIENASLPLNGLLISEAYRTEETGNAWSDLRRLPEVELAALRVERVVLQGQLEDLGEKLQTLQDQQSRQQAIDARRVQSLQSELATNQSNFTKTQSDLIVTQNALREQKKELEAMLNSRAWRVAMTIRNYASRFPRLSDFSWQALRAIKRISRGSTRSDADPAAYASLPLSLRLAVALRNKRVLARILSRPFRDQELIDFDEPWYLDTYPDVKQAGGRPLRHFLLFGIFEGRAPNAYALHFDRNWYLETYPDVARYGDPLQHFLRHGAAEGRIPNAKLRNFDASWYLETHPEIKNSGQIPLLHYLRNAIHEAFFPSTVDPQWYLETYVDVAQAGQDPRHHFLQYGAAEGRFPNAASKALALSIKNRHLNAIAADLRNLGELGAAAILELSRDGATQAARKFHPFRPLNVTVDERRGAAAKLHILLPSVKKEHATGGPNTAFLLGVLLAQQGIPVDFVSTDTPPDQDLSAISDHLKSLTGFGPEQLSIEFLDASDSLNPLSVGSKDAFLATAWWTAQAAHATLSKTSNSRFYYLIQDFEPLFYGASENWCQAFETYSFKHVPLINTTLLRDFLRDQKVGQFADAVFADKALAFEPAVDQSHFYQEKREPGAQRRLLFYARPTVAERNLFGMGVAALQAAVTAGLFGDGGWEFVGIGEKFDPVPLGRGYTLSPAPWRDFEGYAAQMRSADVLLSLMLSPHPSYPPLEMAACGGAVVTTVYGSKTAERLAALSANIIGVPSSINSLVWGLQRAVRRSDDSRAVVAPLALPQTWTQSLAAILPSLLEELATDGIGPIDRARNLPPPETSTALALQGELGPFYNERRLKCRDLYMPSETRGLFSLLTTVYDTDPQQLIDLAHSIFGQDAETDFEWILLDNGSSKPETLAAMELLRTHPKVRFERVADNLGIIRGMRRCLEQARGRYVVPVDSDDLLFPQCLRVMAASIEQNGFPSILYTDEDKTDGQHHLHLYAKPDWDPVLFIHSCFIAHITAIDREKALALNCYTDSSANGSHDWDTFVRFLVNGETPVHLAEPLYAWRMHPGSTSANFKSKDYIYDSQRFVLQNYLRGRSLQNAYGVELSPLFGGTPDWRFVPLAQNDSLALASIVIDLPSGGGRLDAATAEAIYALPASVTHVHLQSHDCSIIDMDWATEAKTLTDLFPDAVIIGGRIHNGSVICEAGYVFGYENTIGCPDIERPLTDPGYFVQLWKPHSVGAVSARHCVVQREFLVSALRDTPHDIDIQSLGLWLGAHARDRQARVIYTPFFEAKISAPPQKNLDLGILTARFGHLIHDRSGYSPRLDRSGSHPYEPGAGEAVFARLPYDHFLADQRVRLQSRRESASTAPISLLTTVYQKTDATLFLETAECVISQTAKPLEWIVLAHGPITAELEHVLDELSRNGSIRLLRLDTNLGIAGGLRHCLENAHGEFVMALDGDDLLERRALASLTEAITAHPDIQVMYSDEDLWIQGSPRHPYMRPDFDPALLSAHSYVWHAIAFRRDTGLALGAFTNRGAEYAQDWDVLLRFMWAGHTPLHLPEILYHWRQHERSLSHSGQVFEGSLISIRNLLGEVAARTGHPHRYEVQPYPFRIGDIDYYIRRHPIDAPSVARIDLGDRHGKAISHGARTQSDSKFPFAAESSIACERGRAGLVALEAAVAASECDLVLLLSAGLTLMDEQGLWQAVKQLELLPDALGVGGPLVDAGGVVRFGPVVETPDRRLVDPSIGKSLTNAGSFSLALKPHCVTVIGPDLILARRQALLDALRAAPAALTLRGLGAWLGLYSRRQGRRLVYEPLFCAGVHQESARLGDSLEGLRNQWKWLLPLVTNAPMPIQGLSGFVWASMHHD